MSARGDDEVLPPGGGEEALEAVVLDGDTVPLLQVERGLAGAQGAEELGGRHEDGELELEQVAAAGDVHRVETGAVHADVEGRAVGRPGGALEAGQVTHPALAAGRADALRGAF